MRAFRLLLVAMTIGITIYTVIAVMDAGWAVIPVAIENITSLTWIGQFVLDFAMYLVLSAIWLAWRHNFSPIGIILALLASVLGILFFAPYLLVISFQTNGDMKAILLGEERAKE